jgi:uncharacterized membrane protein YedE/YeeE
MYLQSLVGGLMIGAAAALLLLGGGQIAGCSGILGNVVRAREGLSHWRLLFLFGLLAAPLLVRAFGGTVLGRLDLGWPQILISGLLVGFGTQLGSGCTSGHGVCGLGNLSRRSLAAGVTFMTTAAITVFVVRHVLAGA